MVDLTGFDFEIKSYFSTNNAVDAHCLAILPLEPKRKLQKCKLLTNLDNLFMDAQLQRICLQYDICNTHKEGF